MIYTQEEMDEVEAELFETQELLDKQDRQMKDFNSAVQPMRQHSDSIIRIVKVVERELRGRGLPPQMVHELITRSQALDDMLNNRKPQERIDKFGVPSQIQYGQYGYTKPSPSFRI